MKPSGVRAPQRVGVALDVGAQDVEAAQRGGLEHVGLVREGLGLLPLPWYMAARTGESSDMGRRYRSSPHTRSVTSFVNAASARKLFGLPLEVSENATVPASIRAR